LKNSHLLYKYKFYLCPTLFRWWQAADLCQKPVAERRSREKTCLYVFTCFSCGGAERRRKIGGPQAQESCPDHRKVWTAACHRDSKTNFSPVWAGSVFDLTLIEVKDKLVTAFKVTIRKFLKVLAVHLQGLIHALVSLLAPPFFVSMSL
jgi:hypothetical protein